MAADLETRARQLMLGQTEALRLLISTSRPEPDAEQDMLFKRSVEVPPDTDLEVLLAKWNPGVPPETLDDLIGAVCRWNQLKNAESIRPGQKLLIPSVIPHGKEPEKRLRLALIGDRPDRIGPRPQLPGLAAPPVSARLSMTSGVLEQRLRSQATVSAAERPRELCVSKNQAGQSLSGGHVKQQLQGSVWQHRPQQLPVKIREARA